MESTLPTRPQTLADLVVALAALPTLPPIEQARQCPLLIEDAKRVLASHRGAAIVAAQASGAKMVTIAAELGVSVSKVADAATRYRRGTPT